SGIVILNEVGLDPGIDHMSAMRVIHAAQNQGGHVYSFESVCGGLPAPEAADNPLGYKFSWSPRGVLMAARNAAKYLRDGKVSDPSSCPAPCLRASLRVCVCVCLTLRTPRSRRWPARISWPRPHPTT